MYDDPADRPYGPTNPDYEYDAERQRKDEEPDEETENALKKYLVIALACTFLQGCAGIRAQNKEIAACMPCSLIMPTAACRSLDKCNVPEEPK